MENSTEESNVHAGNVDKTPAFLAYEFAVKLVQEHGFPTTDPLVAYLYADEMMTSLVAFKDLCVVLEFAEGLPKTIPDLFHIKHLEKMKQALEDKQSNKKSS